MIMKFKIVWVLVMMLSLHGYSREKYGDSFSFARSGTDILEVRKGNLSVGASTVASSSKGKHSSAKAVDGSLTSFWQSSQSAGWIVVDLKTSYSLTSICQVFHESSVWKFKVEGSVDKENWLLLVDKTKGASGDVFAESVSGVYRYVKLTVLESKDGFLPSSKEFIINGTNADKNIALGKQCTNVVLQKDHNPNDALDGNMSTYWIADNGQFPQSLTVDLEEVCTLSGIQQIFKDHDSWKFKIEGSNDELHWAVLVDNTDGISGFDFKTQVSGEFRYIRLTILGSAKGYWAHSCEFRVFGTEKDVVSLGGRELEDLAFNALAATSSFCDNNHTQKKAFDGDNTTFWYADNNAYPQWLCADLGLPCDVRNIKQTFVEKDVWSFIIEGSNDNKKWDLLADCRSGIAGIEYVKELNGVYRYIKLTILDAKSKSRAGSRSLVIKGFGSPRNATWWEETSGMTRYYPKYYRQTLNSIKDSLDILQAQGYRNIELSAIYEGDPSVWGGLGATNNYAIDPSIGTLEDFEDLLHEVHARDMRLTFFGNVGYCWYKAPFFEKACDDQRNDVYSKERNWFHFSDKKLNDNWFWSDRAQAYYYSCWGNSDGAEGRIPSYNFNNWEWQEECRNYLDFWADKGVDGILLDAPEVYDGITDDIINESIIKVLNRRGILTNAEGASNIEKWISRFDFKLIQGFDMYGWGGGKRSEVLNARRNQNPCELNGKLKSYRDRIVALGATTITPPMWEIPATNEERLFELAYLISMGTVVINHYGDHHSDYIAQFILDKWPQKDQKKFYDLIRLQNGYNGLAPMGQRTCIPSNDDSKYTVFKRSNKDGKVSALVIMNFQNSTETISVNLKNTGILLGQTPLNLLDGDNIPPVLSEDYHITLPPYGYMILGIQNEE